MSSVPASPPSSAAQVRRSSPAASLGRHHNEGHGRRLTAAFEALEAFPALAESRNRVLRLFSEERISAADVVAAVESDVALAIAVLRLANRAQGKTQGRVDSVVKAVEGLSPQAVRALACRARARLSLRRPPAPTVPPPPTSPAAPRRPPTARRIGWRPRSPTVTATG